ncbi:MAG: hypothetical protein ACTHLE_11640 [Agriterribacter sp.]
MKILVKDDWSILRTGICGLIRQHLNEIHPIECNDTTNLFENVVSSECNLAIINFRTTPAEASAQLRLFRQIFPQLPVIIMGSGAENYDEVLNTANTFFINDNCSLEELTGCIERAAGKNI